MSKKLGKKMAKDEAYSVTDHKAVKMHKVKAVKYKRGTGYSYMLKGVSKDGKPLSRITSKEHATKVAGGSPPTATPKAKAVVKHRVANARCKAAGRLAIAACEERSYLRALARGKHLFEGATPAKKKKSPKKKAKKAAK